MRRGGKIIAVLAWVILVAVWAQAAKKPAAADLTSTGGPSLSDINLRALESLPTPAPKAWGRDPFLPVPKAATGEGPLEMSAVILGNGRGVAIINKRIYRVGDVVSGRVIERILQDRVILSDGNGVLELRVQSLSDGRLNENGGMDHGTGQAGTPPSGR